MTKENAHRAARIYIGAAINLVIVVAVFVHFDGLAAWAIILAWLKASARQDEMMEGDGGYIKGWLAGYRLGKQEPK